MARGLLVVGSGPSGVGKGTVHAEILKRCENMDYSISITTRKPRCGEIDGKDYFFVTKEKMLQMIDNDELLEYADVFGNFYGTPKAYVEKQLAAGRDVLLEIDVQGALQIKEKMPEALLIFIAPPNMDELERRLRGRNTDAPEVIERRLTDAIWEMDQQKKYDYVVVNDTVDKAVEEYLEILQKEKEKRK